MHFDRVTWFALRSVAGLAFATTYSLASFMAHASADSTAHNSTMRAAAVVNDIVISTYDLEQRIKLAMVTSGQQPNADLAKRLHDQILRQLVDEMLQLLEAQKFNVKVTNDDVEGALKRIGQQNNITSEQITKMLDDNGIARATLNQQIQADIAWQKLVQQRLAPRVTVSDQDIDDVLARMKETASSAQYLLAEIYVPVESPEKEGQARESITNIRAQLSQGASFAAMARQFSKTSTSNAGGDMGWVTQADLQPEVAKVVRTMSPASVSEPIRSSGGFYLVGLREKRSAAGSKPEAATPTPPPRPSKRPRSPRRCRAALRWRRSKSPSPAELRRKSRRRSEQTAIKLFQSVNGCGNLAALAKANGATTVPLGAVDVKDLAPDFRKILEKTPNGRSTPPLRSGTGVQMFVICSGGMVPAQGQVAGGDTGDHTVKPFVMPTREDIQNRLYSQELSMMARRYLRDLRRDASIDIRDN